jgi:hypothetical protein
MHANPSTPTHPKRRGRRANESDGRCARASSPPPSCPTPVAWRLHAPEQQRDDITKHPLHKLVQPHGSRIDTRTAGHIMSACSHRERGTTPRRCCTAQRTPRTANDGNAGPRRCGSATRRAPLRRWACAARSSPPHPHPARPRSSALAAQRTAPAAPPSTPTPAQDLVAARQDVRRCGAALALRAAAAAPAPCPPAQQRTRCAAHSAPPHRQARQRPSKTSTQRGATCAAALRGLPAR